MPAPSRAPLKPIFIDQTGRRWRNVRRTALAIGVLSTIVALAVVVVILRGEQLPDYQELLTAPRIGTTRIARRHNSYRARLLAALRRRPPPPARRPAQVPLPVHRAAARTAVPATKREPIVVGFYVNWDDNSLASLNLHSSRLDWVVCEWAFVAPSGDSLVFDIEPRGKRVFDAVAKEPAATRPKVFLLASNVSRGGATFDTRRLAHLLTNPAARERVLQQLVSAVQRYDLAGVTIDFESAPDALQLPLARFISDLHARLAPMGRLVTQALDNDLDEAALARYGRVNDYVFPMLYDEHYRTSDPGPVASQSWYMERVQRVVRAIPPAKVIVAHGAFGYNWQDASPELGGEAMTYQETMRAAREHRATIAFDRISLNPYASWTEPDSTDHVVWFLDAVTSFNQIRASDALGVGGHAIWRLGAEDPSVWRVLGAHGLERAATALDSIPSGYDVEFDGEGEVLKLAARPTVGLRTLHADSASGLIVDERLARYSTPYVVQRFGGDTRGDAPKRIALTFDDGPDPRWTPQILDTLRSRGAKGTFFVIGQNVDAHIGLMRRVVSEGNEFGNHTYSHPNLALTSDFVTRMELSANQFLLEAIVGRRSALFRPPYFGDAEPTTADELVPVDIASRRGYLTVGLHIDAEDWAGLDAKTIVDTVLSQRERGNIVLLHDGGGGRAQTVAALGPLIDSLRARGDTIVLVSELAGLSPLQSMPPLPPESIATRALGLVGFWLLGAFEWVLYWAFFIAVILGLARLLLITALAAIQRVRARSEEVVDPDFRPVVSVVVPAFNEARVINATIASLLEQEYAGEIEIVVVDDGSKDGTAAVARERFGDHPRVTILEKENGGKASALNYGIRRARGEIVIGLDADTVFMPNTVAKLVAPMRDAHVGAVAGNAKVGNRVNLVTRWQALEYVTSQNLDRRAFSLLNCITVVPGAVGAWRTSLVLKVGGFSDRTLAEDQDLTLAIRRLGYTIAYADEAIAYTEAPETLRALAKQRFRWAFGTLQCAWKYRPLLFRPRYGTLGFIALPNLWIFQLFFAAISPLADLMFVWSLLSVWLTWREHGDTYAATSLEHVLGYYAVFLIVDWFAAVIGFLMEPDEERSLTWLIFIQRFVYRQIMYWVVVRSFVAAMRGGVVGWGKLERTGRMEAEGVGLRT